MKQSTALSTRILVRASIALFSLAMIPFASAQETATTAASTTTAAAAAPEQPKHHHYFWHHCAKENNLQPGQHLTADQKKTCFAEMQAKAAADLKLAEGSTPTKEQMHNWFAQKRAKREAFRAACRLKLDVPADQKLTHEQYQSCKASTTTST